MKRTSNDVAKVCLKNRTGKNKRMIESRKE